MKTAKWRAIDHSVALSFIGLLAVGFAGQVYAADGDKKFAEKAAAGGMAEVELATLAQQRASSEDVKQLAQTIAQDHEKANKALMDIASSEKINLPQKLDSKHQRERDKLSKLNGGDFDRQYVKTMIDEHKEDIKEFEKEANKGKDGNLKSWASQTLPALRQHLQAAEVVQSKLQNTGSSGTGGGSAK